MRLSKTAFQPLSEEVKASYSDTECSHSKVQACRHRETLGNGIPSVNPENSVCGTVGVTASENGFPNVIGKGLDRLMKGHFFQALLPKWQKKLGELNTVMSSSIMHMLNVVNSSTMT